MNSHDQPYRRNSSKRASALAREVERLDAGEAAVVAGAHALTTLGCSPWASRRMAWKESAPGVIRTPDPLVRSLSKGNFCCVVLCFAELC